MGVNHADVFAVVFRFDKALHHFFAFTTGKVTRLRADNFDVWRILNGFGKAFLTVNGDAGSNGALQLHHVAWFAIHFFYQPVTDQFAFENVVGSDGGHIERFVFHIDGTVKQEDRDFGIFRLF